MLERNKRGTMEKNFETKPKQAIALEYDPAEDAAAGLCAPSTKKYGFLSIIWNLAGHVVFRNASLTLSSLNFTPNS